MSTFSRGNSFEERVYTALARELQDERLCVSPKYARIYRKKAYYSRDRESDIVTDVSVEVFLPERDRPTLVWIFECKDYSGRIPVCDIEEFHAKLQQIGEDNTKGTFVTSGALQDGALAYARSKKLGVVRLLPSDQIEILVELALASNFSSSNVNWSEFRPALSNPSHRSRRGFFAVDDDYMFANWHSLLSKSLGSKR